MTQVDGRVDELCPVTITRAPEAPAAGATGTTHVPPWADGQALLAEAKAAFDGPVELVAPDAGYDV
ncbi:MAG: hypothetical protein ACT4RN_01665 [Pseudonocardia sp.]